MTKKYHVYGLGAALVDTEVEVNDEFLARAGIEKGLMTLVDEARQHELMEVLERHLVGSRRSSGGSAANSIIAASHFGADAYYSCKVANDDNGHFYLKDIRQAGVDSNFHSDPESGITGKCLVMITPDAERTMNTYLGISERLSHTELNLEALADSEYLYFEGYLVTWRGRPARASRVSSSSTTCTGWIPAVRPSWRSSWRSRPRRGPWCWSTFVPSTGPTGCSSPTTSRSPSLALFKAKSIATELWRWA